MSTTNLTDDGFANDCTHGSAAGIDTTPVSDPGKVWRCDHCGLCWSEASPLRYSEADLAARLAAVRAQIEADLIASVLAPQWRTNRGHEFDGTAEAYAAGRNDVIDLLRALTAGGDA